MDRIDLPKKPRILVVALRRLGDVLLTTPLIRSLKRAWPDSSIDVLVFQSTAPILQGNPDIDTVVGMPEPASALQSLRLAARLWKRYALAVTTQAGDRPTFFAIAAGQKHVGPVQARLSGRIVRRILDRSVDMQAGMHRVEENLLLAKLLGAEPCPQIVVPHADLPAEFKPQEPYAVIHAAPFFRYKQWHREGWRAIAAHLARRGMTVVATGGPGEEERRYLDDIWQGIDVPVRRVDGRLSWPQLAALLSGARAFVGPDTSVTHLAAATGCPTIALYGPTDPRVWGPWPAQGLQESWLSSGNVQNRGNVWLVQNPLDCMPCGKEGCLRHLQSYSLCLDQLPVQRVAGALDQALVSQAAGRPAARGGVTAQTPLRNG